MAEGKEQEVELIRDLFHEVKDQELLEVLNVHSKTILKELIWRSKDIEKLKRLKDMPSLDYNQQVYLRGLLPKEIIIVDLNKMDKSTKAGVFRAYKDPEICNLILKEKQGTKEIKEAILSGEVNNILNELEGGTKTIREAIAITRLAITGEAHPIKSEYTHLVKNPDITEGTLEWIQNEASKDEEDHYTLVIMATRDNLPVMVQKALLGAIIPPPIDRAWSFHTNADIHAYHHRILTELLKKTKDIGIFKEALQKWCKYIRNKYDYKSFEIFENPVLEDIEMFKLFVTKAEIIPSTKTMKKLSQERLMILYKTNRNDDGNNFNGYEVLSKVEVYKHMDQEHRALIDMKGDRL